MPPTDRGHRPLSLRSAYKVFYPLTTRWSDNDIYGHVNNVVYYSYFDTVANRYLIEEGGMDISDGTIVGYVVNSGCQYLGPITYPEPIEAGLRVEIQRHVRGLCFSKHPTQQGNA